MDLLYYHASMVVIVGRLPAVDGPGTPSPMPNFVKIAQKIAQWACRYCIAPQR